MALINFISLFSGVGGLDFGFTKAGWNCVGWCELDKFAHKAYQIIHDTKGEIPNEFDVRQISEEFIQTITKRSGRIDAIVGGFPCQAFSIAGKREGFTDQTRGTLFFEIARIAKIAKPQYLILENVKGLLNHDGGRTFEIILSALDELGYDCEWQCLNSKDFGVPQNRERVFIIGCARGTGGSKVFPFFRKNNGTIKVIGKLGKGFKQINEILNPNGISTSLRTFQGGNLQPKVLIRESLHDGILINHNQLKIKNDVSNCITANYWKGLDNHGQRTGIMHENLRIRKLTPLECFRLQSYPDEWYHTLKEHGFSNTQLYKMAGNGVTSNVAFEIAKKIFNCESSDAN